MREWKGNVLSLPDSGQTPVIYTPIFWRNAVKYQVICFIKLCLYNLLLQVLPQMFSHSWCFLQCVESSYLPEVLGISCNSISCKFPFTSLTVCYAEQKDMARADLAMGWCRKKPPAKVNLFFQFLASTESTCPLNLNCLSQPGTTGNS